MLILAATLGIVLLVLCMAGRPKEIPMDRDVILRIRRFADDLRREQILPYD